MLGGDVWPMVLAILITLMCAFYLWATLKSYQPRIRALEEGFTNPTKSETLTDNSCYDEFYAKVYDQLVQPAARAGMETKVVLEWMEKAGKHADTLRIADIGCGTGLHVELFAQQGAPNVTGYDKSPAMITEARSRYPERTFIQGDATVATMAAADQYDIITLYYFTLYMVPERQEMLRNIYLWLSPGGIFCVHIVNKQKFDPVLESASPFVGFSVQKYADDRITKSNVTFEEFDYTGDFQLHGSRGVYEEEFSFSNGTSRRHEQRIWMPTIEAVVAEIERAGFKYAQHVDMTAIGYEYQWIFIFLK